MRRMQIYAAWQPVHARGMSHVPSFQKLSSCTASEYAEMIVEDNRHSGLWPKLPVNKFCLTDIDIDGERILPNDW